MYSGTYRNAHFCQDEYSAFFFGGKYAPERMPDKYRMTVRRAVPRRGDVLCFEAERVAYACL